MSLDASLYVDNLSGLRGLLDDWNSGRGPSREMDAWEEAEKQENAQEKIYSSYLERAKEEDEELVAGWGETVDTLLIFAGLQSAIVTAFLLRIDELLAPSDFNDTNVILQGILNRLDNTTSAIFDPPTDLAARQTDVNTTSLWYASLSFSMLSAFGALLCKPWVMHYASRPKWANTTAFQCQLREMRRQGVTKWKLVTVLEWLMILLQISLLLFTVGAVTYIKRISSVLPILGNVLLYMMVAIYAFTLMAGTFIPGCPYKSPATDLLYRLFTFLAIWIPYQTRWVILQIWRPLLLKVWDQRALTIEIRRCYLMLKQALRKLSLSNNLEHKGVTKSDSGAIGTMCRWLVQESYGAELSNVSTPTIIDAMVSYPPAAVYRHMLAVESLLVWAARIFENLRYLDEPVTLDDFNIQMGELLCHLMFHVEHAAHTALVAASVDYTLHPSEEFCRIIRSSWGRVRSGRTMPIILMRWTSVATYYYHQLASWSQLSKADMPNRDVVVDELSIVLTDRRLVEHLDIIATSTALAGLTLVDERPVGTELLDAQDPRIRMFQGLRLLSHYSPDAPAESLLVRAFTETTKQIQRDAHNPRNVFINDNYADLAQSLLRMLRLGTSWRKTESDHQKKSLARQLLGYSFASLDAILNHLHPQATYRGWSAICAPSAIIDAFSGYACGCAGSGATRVHTLRVIDVLVGLRFYSPKQARIIQRNKKNKRLARVSANPASPPITWEDHHSHVVKQFIRDINLSEPHSYERRLVLSILVKANDMFFGKNILDQYDGVIGELRVLLDEAVASGNVLDPLPNSAAADFGRWSELVGALHYVENGIPEKKYDD